MMAQTPLPFTANDESFVLANAYVPEQVPGLMTAISGAVPFLIEDYIGFAKDNWAILVGYPLRSPFEGECCNAVIEQALARYHPDYFWFIGPEVPPRLARSCQGRQSDQYFLLNLAETSLKPSLKREVRQAAKSLTIQHSQEFGQEHQALVEELMRRESLPAMIAELYRSMPVFVAGSDKALVLNARTREGKLSAFFVVETAAESFDTYLLGCHSKATYAPHASDLLFAEMIAHALRRGKSKINLGLGVNQGIRRFKMKWGGKPFLKYEFCECYFGPPKQLSILDSLLGEML